MRVLTLAVSLTLFALAACDSDTSPDDSGPVLQGFSCGGFAGDTCPPESTCASCDEPDCGGPCHATRPCNPDASDCPDPLRCDPTTKFCVPARVCATTADCPSGQLCVTVHLTQGICATVPEIVNASCEKDACPFPYDCMGLESPSCRLWCLDGACPGSMACVEHMCEAQ